MTVHISPTEKFSFNIILFCCGCMNKNTFCVGVIQYKDYTTLLLVFPFFMMYCFSCDLCPHFLDKLILSIQPLIGAMHKSDLPSGQTFRSSDKLNWFK